MINTNVDRLDSAYNTATPFQQGSLLQIGSVKLSPGIILSIKIGCDGSIKLPLRLSGVVMSDESPSCCVVRFSDSYNNITGTCRLWLATATTGDVVTKAILDPEGALIGHMTFNKALPAMLIAAARISGGTAQTGAADFTLLPECYIPWVAGHARVMEVNNTKSFSSLVVKPGILTRANYSQGRYSIGVIGVYNGLQSNNYICKLTVDNLVSVNGTSLTTAQTRSFWVGGKHLVIKHGMTSNLRVVCDGSSIALRGVLDG